jgi:hypothetical protein
VVRRFRDRGKSGWWALLYIVPGIGWLWILIECGFLPGRPSAAYTDNPAPTPKPTPVPAPAPRAAARLQMAAATRTGAVQRRTHQTWDRKRTMQVANVAVRCALAAAAAIMLYRMALDPGTFAVFKTQSMQTVN